MIKVKTFKGMGRGLISNKTIKKGQTVHVAELIVFPRHDNFRIEKTLLDSYVYDIGYGKLGLALGYGSLFNHSNNPNIDYTFIKRNNRTLIKYIALRNIKPNKQLFIDYGYNP